MDDKFSPRPWRFSEARDHIYAANDLLIATLLPGASSKVIPNLLTDLVTHKYSEVLAAAPCILRALDGVKESLEQELDSPHHERADDAIRLKDRAISRARRGYGNLVPPERHWSIALTQVDHAEGKANERILDTAQELLDAAVTVHRVVGQRVGDDAVRALQSTISRTYR